MLWSTKYIKMFLIICEHLYKGLLQPSLLFTAKCSKYWSHLVTCSRCTWWCRSAAGGGSSTLSSTERATTHRAASFQVLLLRTASDGIQTRAWPFENENNVLIPQREINLNRFRQMYFNISLQILKIKHVFSKTTLPQENNKPLVSVFLSVAWCWLYDFLPKRGV